MLGCMRTTLNIDEAVLSRASELTGVREKTALVRMGLEAPIRARDRLFIGGETAKSGSTKKPAPGDPAPEREKGGILRIVSCGDGKILGEMKLDSAPVWDGMSAAEGKLLVSLNNGKIVCLGK